MCGLLRTATCPRKQFPLCNKGNGGLGPKNFPHKTSGDLESVASSARSSTDPGRPTEIVPIERGNRPASAPCSAFVAQAAGGGHGSDDQPPVPRRIRSRRGGYCTAPAVDTRLMTGLLFPSIRLLRLLLQPCAIDCTPPGVAVYGERLVGYLQGQRCSRRGCGHRPAHLQPTQTAGTRWASFSIPMPISATLRPTGSTQELEKSDDGQTRCESICSR